MRVRWVGERPRGVVALVDNVVTTGATAEAARHALGGDAVLLAWADARGIAGDARGIAQPTDAERRAFSQKARSNPLTQPTGSRSIRRAMTLQRRPDGRYIASPANAPKRAALRSYHRDIGLLFSKGDHAGAMELIHAGAGPRANPSRSKQEAELAALKGSKAMTTTNKPARLSYTYNGGWRVTKPGGRTLIFARGGGVWLAREPWMTTRDARQIEGTSDFAAGDPTSKGRAARYAREFFAYND